MYLLKVELSLLHVEFYTFSNQICSLCDPMSTVIDLVSFVCFFSGFCQESYSIAAAL